MVRAAGHRPSARILLTWREWPGPMSRRGPQSFSGGGDLLGAGKRLGSCLDIGSAATGPTTERPTVSSPPCPAWNAGQRPLCSARAGRCQKKPGPLCRRPGARSALEARSSERFRVVDPLARYDDEGRLTLVALHVRFALGQGSRCALVDRRRGRRGLGDAQRRFLVQPGGSTCEAIVWVTKGQSGCGHMMGWAALAGLPRRLGAGAKGGGGCQSRRGPRALFLGGGDLLGAKKTGRSVGRMP